MERVDIDMIQEQKLSLESQNNLTDDVTKNENEQE